MLQAIRDRAQGWIAWAIVILISIPFALWGIQEYLGVGAQPVVASVNDREITEAELDQNYQKFRREMRERLGSAYRPEIFNDKQLRKQVLEDMIRKELILQESRRLGLYAGDQLVRSMIMSIPQFSKNGRFDQAAYERAVRYQGLTSKGFEQRMRRLLITSQLSGAVEASEFVTRAELDEAVRLRDQKRRISYFVLPVSEYMDSREIPEQDIVAYYNSHQNRFRVPEQVKVEYVELDAERIGATLNPDEETLRGFYEAQRDQLGQAERRRASHILVTVAPDADEAVVEDARQKSNEALSRIRNGEDFAVVAGEVSEDPGSAKAGGDLGFFERGVMDPAFEDAAFTAEVGKVVGPIRSRFGFHIIKVTDIERGKIPSFEEQRDKLLEAYRRSEGERRFYDYAERLSDLSYENPDSLEPAANALGVEITTSDWITRQGGGGVLGFPKVVAAAFSEDVLGQGNNSEAIELGPEHIVVLRVADHKEATVKPLQEVHDEIVAILRGQEAAQKAREQGEALAARLKGGETLAQLAAETGHDLEQPGEIGRDDRSLPPALVASVFRLARPEEGRPANGTAVLDNHDFVLIELHEVADGDAAKLDAAALNNEKTALQRSRGRSYFDHLVQHLRDEADVKLQ